MNLPPLDASCGCNHMPWVPLSLTSSNFCFGASFFFCLVSDLYSFPSVAHTGYSLSSPSTKGRYCCFHPLATMNAQNPLQTHIYIHPGHIPGGQATGSCVNTCLSFWKHVNLFNKVIRPFTSRNSVWGFPFLRTSPTPAVIALLSLLLMWGGFLFVCLSFSNDEEQHLFMCLFTTDISFLERNPHVTTLKAVGSWRMKPINAAESSLTQ